MSKTIFIFISSILLLLPVLSGAGELSSSFQFLLCTPFILFLGIPHGALDTILYLRNNEIKDAEFNAIYLFIIGLNITLWFIFPALAYFLFLLLSSFHFGQSQFSHYFRKQTLIPKLIYLFWGVSILSGLIYFNVEEIHQITEQYSEFASLLSFHQKDMISYIFFASGTGSILLLLGLTIQKVMKAETFFMEILILALIYICFYLMPLLVGFTLYFVILHSIKVLKEEYRFLNAENEVNSFSGFIKLVAPFTIYSISGIIFLFALIYMNILPLAYGYCLMIVISSITLPHVFVMNRFYNLLLNKNFFRGIA